jgi:hypothetical protein
MRIAIIGGPARKECFNASDYDEVWGMNAVRHPWVKAWTRRFNVNRFAYCEIEWPDGLRLESVYLNREPHVPLYTIDPWPKEIAPNNIIFPRDELRDFPRPDYHCCVTDWLIAYAIHLGATKIALHGISMTLHGNQPLSARPCVEYWCGLAEGKGIEVAIKEDCDLFAYFHLVKSNKIYGVNYVTLIEDETKAKNDLLAY